MSFLSFMRSLSDLTQAIPEEGDPVSTDPASTISPEFDSSLGTLSSILSDMTPITDEQYALDRYNSNPAYWEEQARLANPNFPSLMGEDFTNQYYTDLAKDLAGTEGMRAARLQGIAHDGGISQDLNDIGGDLDKFAMNVAGAGGMAGAGTALVLGGGELLGALGATGGTAGATTAGAADVASAAGAMGGAAGAAGGGLTTLEAAGGLAGLSGAGAAGATLGAETLAGAGGTVGLTDVLTSGAGSAGGEEVFDDIFDLGDLGDVGGDIFGDDYGDVLDGVIGGDFPDMGDFNWEDINLEDFDWGEVFGGENMEDLYDDFWNYFSQEAMGGLVPTNSGPNWWDVGFGLLQYQGQRQFQNDIINSMNQAVERSDPFYSQRPFYQQQFQQMNTDPNYFQNDAALQNLQNSAMRSMASQDAAKGYLNSGNILHDLTRTGVETAANYVLPRMDMSARAAGAYNDPSKAGQMIAAMSPIAASAGLAQNQTLGQIGRSATGAQTGTNSGTNPITSLAQWLTA